MKQRELEYPTCSYCDVDMTIVSKDKLDFICPSCFLPVPRPVTRPPRSFPVQARAL